MTKRKVKLILVPGLVLLAFGISFILLPGLKRLGFGILTFDGVCLLGMLVIKTLGK